MGIVLEVQFVGHPDACLGLRHYSNFHVDSLFGCTGFVTCDL